jgi:predicted nuclease of restriction endonuclease-like (RecB) superfamily
MDVDKIYTNIKTILDDSRKKFYQTANSLIVQTYWEIGRIILEEEQQGMIRAKYAEYLLTNLSKKLISEYGRGFSVQSLKNMRLFYLTFPKSSAVRSQLSWTHYKLIMRVNEISARNFYIIETANNHWSTRELERQINSMLFERLSLSKDKKKVLELSKKGQIIEKPADMVKDPYIFEFIGLEQRDYYSENDLESKLIDNLKRFLLELGKGFMFVERQKRISIDDENFFIDLVFYNRILRCFVLIELKLGKLTHKDLGQLQMYVNYYDCEIKDDSENPTIGILLCSDKKETIVRYTLPQDNSHIFASKYKIYLPKKEDLEQELKRILR